MATDLKSPEAIERLNALVDGELPPAEHAALADRIAAGPDLAHAHATLARLKACIVESAERSPVLGISLAKPRRPRRLPMFAAASAIATAAAVVVGVFVWNPDGQQTQIHHAEIASLVTLATLPDAPVIPDLANAGLNLVGGEVERSGDTSVLVAAYRGPRGCRLELRVRPAGADVPPTVGTSRKAWTAGDLTYELVAFGMPVSRFAAVALAAEAATHAGQIPDDVNARLREASLKAGPCTG